MNSLYRVYVINGSGRLLERRRQERKSKMKKTRERGGCLFWPTHRKDRHVQKLENNKNIQFCGKKCSLMREVRGEWADGFKLTGRLTNNHSLQSYWAEKHLSTEQATTVEGLSLLCARTRQADTIPNPGILKHPIHESRYRLHDFDRILRIFRAQICVKKNDDFLNRKQRKNNGRSRLNKTKIRNGYGLRSHIVNRKMRQVHHNLKTI